MANVRFKLNWKLAIFVVVFFPLTLTLGFWQLDRASQKQQLIDEHGSLVMRAPISIDAVEGVTLADYTPVKAKGTFLSEAFLLDNPVFELMYIVSSVSGLYLMAPPELCPNQ